MTTRDHPICPISYLIDAAVDAGNEVKITNDTIERIRKRSRMSNYSIFIVVVLPACFGGGGGGVFYQLSELSFGDILSIASSTAEALRSRDVDN